MDGRDKMQAYRQRLRRRGLRPVQLWVPDTHSRRFAAAARRQSRLVRDDPHEQEVLDFIESAADTSGWRP